MSEAVRFDDFPALSAITARGFDDWGDEIEIDAARVAGFGRVTGTSAAAGAIPGCMLQSMLPVLVPERSWSVSGNSSAINLGSPSIRFPAPAPVGARLRGRARLAGVAPHARGVIHTLEFEVRADDAADPCLRSSVDLLYMGERP